MKNSTDNPSSDTLVNNELRIIFAGTPDFAAEHLEALLQAGRAKGASPTFNIVAVYTQPDRPAGRGKKLTPSPVKQLALDKELPVCQPASLTNEEAQAELAAFKPDLMIVVAYGLLLPKAVLEIPRLGCINVHASLLPRWRGAAPIQRAIEAGDPVTGITIMQMDEGLDTGDMLLKKESPILPTDTTGSLFERLATVGCSALIESITQLAIGASSPVSQDDALTTYAGKISKKEALLDWQQGAETLALKVRAFNPFPVACSLISGERVRVWQAVVANVQHAEAPGTLMNAGEQGLLVACGEGALLLTEIQLAGKKRLPVAEVLKSRANLFVEGVVFGEEG